MIIFEKYMNNGLNPIVKFSFNQRLKYDRKFKEQFDNYKNESTDLKYMFFINDAEKEINKNKHLRKFDEIINNFIVSKNNSNDILNYLSNAF